jgi:hypothetical protein
LLHRFAPTLVRHKVLLRVSGFADETKFTVTKLLLGNLSLRSTPFRETVVGRGLAPAVIYEENYLEASVAATA